MSLQSTILKMPLLSLGWIETGSLTSPVGTPPVFVILIVASVGRVAGRRKRARRLRGERLRVRRRASDTDRGARQIDDLIAVCTQPPSTISVMPTTDRLPS